jgi:hypothetical protein
LIFRAKVIYGCAKRMQMKKNFEKPEKKITYAMFLHTAPIFLHQIKVKQYDIKEGRIVENGSL